MASHHSFEDPRSRKGVSEHSPPGEHDNEATSYYNGDHGENFDSWGSDIGREHKKLSVEVEEMTAELDSVVSQLENITHNQKKDAAKITKLKARTTASQTERAKLKTREAELRSQQHTTTVKRAAELNEELNDVGSHLHEIALNHKKYEEEVEELHARTTKSKAEIAKLQTRQADLKRQLVTATAKLKALRIKCDEAYKKDISRPTQKHHHS